MSDTANRKGSDTSTCAPRTGNHARRATRTPRAAHLIVAMIVLTMCAQVSGGAAAQFSDTSNKGTNAFNTSWLQPPTSPTATVSGATVTVGWNASVSGIAAATEVYRSATPGGPYTLIATVTPTTTTSYVDTVAASGTYYYVVRAIVQNWFSANSTEVAATVSLGSATALSACTSQAADTGGDGNGYEVTPANACAEDALVATDSKSGSGTSLLCTSAAKDRHRFSTFGLGVPATATILGIEVQVKVGTNNNAGSSLVCAQLSGDGGISWSPVINSAVLTNTGLTLYTLGGVANTWGRIWTGSEFTDANFRVRLIDVSDQGSKDFDLDSVKVRVTYAP